MTARLPSALAAAPAMKDLDSEELCGFLDEIREQPPWRREADVAADYYDGNQLDNETLQDMDALGMPNICENLIAPTIDAVLGLEAKTRTDWRVTPENDERWSEVAEALSRELGTAEKASRADRACSDAYAGEVKSGLGWVEVSRESDPFRFPYRVRSVHRNEIWWDWRAKEPDLSDARWLIRRRWVDLDLLGMVWPQHADLLAMAGHGWAHFDPILNEGLDTGLRASLEFERGAGWEEIEWRDTARSRVALYEVWYRRWVKGVVLRLPTGQVIEYDEGNDRHVAAVANGIVEPAGAIFGKVRQAWYCGPHRLHDEPSPYRHGHFPYVPWWGKREDLSGVPYGLIRSMRPMQDEVNARNAKLLWLLAAKRVMATRGAVKNKELARREIARPDAWIDLDADHMAHPGARFQVDEDAQLSQQQYQMLVDKRQALQNVGGIYSAFMGRESRQAASGIALNSLVEQSTQTLAEINDNARYARTLVGELLLSLIIEDMGRAPREVRIKSEMGSERRIVLNAPQPGLDGAQALTNDVQLARLKVALNDVPSTQSYRMQQLQWLTEITKALPPNIQALVTDFILASTDLPQRHEIIERIQKALGIAQPQPPKTPEEAQAMQQQQAVAAAQAELAARAAQAEVAAKEAEAATKQAQAEKLAAEAQDLRARLAQGALPAEAAREYETRIAEIEQAGAQQAAKLEAQLQQLARELADRRYQIDRDYQAKIEVARMSQAQAPAPESGEREAAAARERAHKERAAQGDDAIAKALARFEQALAPLAKRLDDTAAEIDAKIAAALKAGEAAQREAAPITVTVPVTVVDKGATTKRGRLTKQADGTWSVESHETPDDSAPA